MRDRIWAGIGLLSLLAIFILAAHAVITGDENIFQTGVQK